MAQMINSLFLNSGFIEVGKITRPFRYDLNLIPYNYTVEVMNRLKRLDLVGRVPEEQWIKVPNTA